MRTSSLNVYDLVSRYPTDIRSAVLVGENEYGSEGRRLSVGELLEALLDRDKEYNIFWDDEDEHKLYAKSPGYSLEIEFTEFVGENDLRLV